MNEIARKANIPRETVMFVEPEIDGYAGKAIAVDVNGEDVIVIGRTTKQLQAALTKLHPGSKLTISLCHDVVLVAAHHVALDDEL